MKTSRHLALKTFRITSFIAMTFVFLTQVCRYLPVSLYYFTNWGVTITFFYFASVLPTNFVWNSKTISDILFTTIWPCNWTVTIIYWTYLYPIFKTELWLNLQIHFLPIFLTVIDSLFNSCNFMRKYYFYPFVIIFVYTMVNLSVTLSSGVPIYPGLNFKNFLTYGLLSCLPVVSIISLETIKLVKRKIAENQENRKKGKKFIESEMSEVNQLEN
ncbi:hypothetical protein SteCoe_29893 [Stentor coeruleus]|uniref:Glycerophosphocholine acyltransferase 1 n=1 Tax=Stentor coeruleus TaxID=5963 RepID=A0A1R2B4T7_9CILI|nr:hypothetical protein SteCoe_29893 [Stentor coeruleus]